MLPSRNFSNRSEDQRLLAEDPASIGDSLEVHAFMKCLSEVAAEAELKSAKLKVITSEVSQTDADDNDADPPTYLLNMAESYGFSQPRRTFNQRFAATSASRSFKIPLHRKILGMIKQWVSTWPC